MKHKPKQSFANPPFPNRVWEREANRGWNMKTNKILHNVFFIIMFVFVFGMPMNKNLIAQNQQGDKINIDSTVKNIRKLLSEIKTKSQIDSTHLQSTIKFFRQNEKLKVKSFPNNMEDERLFYDAVKMLENKSDNNNVCFESIINLQLIIINNSEFAEHLTSIIPRIALKNTKGFVQIYSKLNDQERDYLSEGFYYFKSDEKNKFIKNLNALQDSTLKVFSSSIIRKLKNID